MGTHSVEARRGHRPTIAHVPTGTVHRLSLEEACPEKVPEMYSKVKQFLRRVAARTKGDLYDAIGEALKQVTPQDIMGWFKEAGLCATHG
jgi:hypothetical protein